MSPPGLMLQDRSFLNTEKLKKTLTTPQTDRKTTFTKKEINK